MYLNKNYARKDNSSTLDLEMRGSRNGREASRMETSGGSRAATCEQRPAGGAAQLPVSGGGSKVPQVYDEILQKGETLTTFI